jgi:hypothetical protein
MHNFTQVHKSALHNSGVSQLIAQLESEVSSESRRSTVRRWTFGAVATVTGVLALLVTLIAWQIRSEFAADDSGSNAPVTTGSPSPEPRPINNPDDGKGAARPAPPPQPDPVEPEPAPAGTGFRPVGRYRVVNHDNQQLAFMLALNPNSTFNVQAGAGIYSFPLSGGGFAYDAASGTLQLTGLDINGGGFSEPMQVYERHEQHFHAMYAGVRWDLFPE